MVSELSLSQRERISKKLVEAELGSSAAAKQARALRDAVKKLQRDRHFSSVYATAVMEQKDLLLEKLVEFETTNKALRKLLRAQQAYEVSSNEDGLVIC